nr:expressed protein [Hymenolepis microstoma]
MPNFISEISIQNSDGYARQREYHQTLKKVLPQLLFHSYDDTVSDLNARRLLRGLEDNVYCQGACEALSKCFPTAFVDGTFNDLLAEEPATQRSLTILIEQMNRPQISSSNAAGVAPSAAADSVDNSGLKVNANSNNDVGENMGDACNAVAGADNQ